MKEFEEALAILSNHHRISVQKKEEKTRKIKRKYAFYRFYREEYDEAMTLMLECQIDPVLVIGLFPGLLDSTIQEGLVYPDGSNSLSEIEVDFDHRAYLSLIRYLTSIRTRLHALSRVGVVAGRRKSIINDNSVGSVAANDVVTTRSRHVPDLLTAVDTTLLKIYLKVNPAMVGPLVRITNNCDEAETPALLEANDRLLELLDFYRCKGKHGEALTLMYDK